MIEGKQNNPHLLDPSPMETREVRELFPLFSTASQETLDGFLEVAEEESYSKDEVIVKEGDWGKSVFWIVSGWVKFHYLSGTEEVALDVFSEGDYLGEMAVLNESPRSSEMIALSDVQLLTISAQRFLQLLFKDPQVQQRLLQLTFRRVNQFYRRCQLRHQSSPKKLVKLLIYFAESYGKSTEKGIKIFDFSSKDLANIADISVAETSEILKGMYSKGWIERDSGDRALYLMNLKQLAHFVRQF